MSTTDDNEARLAEIRERVGKATPGLHLERYPSGGGRFSLGSNLVVDFFDEDNRDFFEYAQADTVYLLDLCQQQAERIEEMKTENERLREQLDQHIDLD